MNLRQQFECYIALCFKSYIYIRFTITEAIATAAIYSVIVPLSEASGIVTTTFNEGTGYMFLLAGWGLLIWQRFTLKYRKRLAYLLSIAGVLVRDFQPVIINSAWSSNCPPC